MSLSDKSARASLIEDNSLILKKQKKSFIKMLFRTKFVQMKGRFSLKRGEIVWWQHAEFLVVIFHFFPPIFFSFFILIPLPNLVYLQELLHRWAIYALRLDFPFLKIYLFLLNDCYQIYESIDLILGFHINRSTACGEFCQLCIKVITKSVIHSSKWQ